MELKLQKTAADYIRDIEIAVIKLENMATISREDQLKIQEIVGQMRWLLSATLDEY